MRTTIGDLDRGTPFRGGITRLYKRNGVNEGGVWVSADQGGGVRHTCRRKEKVDVLWKRERPDAVF